MFRHAGPYLDAYRRTNYAIDECGRTIRFVPDRRCGALDCLLGRHKTQSAAYLSAFNPESKPTSDALNRRAQRRLIAHLVRNGIRVLRGAGEAQDGGWHEEGLVAFPLSRRRAARIGRMFRQNAFLACQEARQPAVVALR
jgi:hypothetical protein